MTSAPGSSPVAGRIPVVVSWSGGKDSALVVRRLRADPRYEIAALLTTVTQPSGRVSIHGIRREIAHAQAAALGLPLHETAIPQAASNAAYEHAFGAALARLRAARPAVTTIAFGDLFLTDVRTYRERLLAPLGWTPLFPLWGADTGALAREFVADGFRAALCCVDTAQLDAAWAGREFDASLLAALPADVDPCGERGEFHTCVYAGPIFSRPIPLERGERLRRDERFEYCDFRAGDAGRGAA